jgi:hypothetical protein
MRVSREIPEEFRIGLDRREVTCPQGKVSKGVARSLPGLLARRGPAHRGQVHQGPVPALPGAGRVHHLRRRQAHCGLPPGGNCPDCGSATALTSWIPPGASATPSGPASRAPPASSPAATERGTAATAGSLPGPPRPARHQTPALMASRQLRTSRGKRVIASGAPAGHPVGRSPAAPKIPGRVKLGARADRRSVRER